jgi:hypothetical protein
VHKIAVLWIGMHVYDHSSVNCVQVRIGILIQSSVLILHSFVDFFVLFDLFLIYFLSEHGGEVAIYNIAYFVVMNLTRRFTLNLHFNFYHSKSLVTSL